MQNLDLFELHSTLGIHEKSYHIGYDTRRSTWHSVSNATVTTNEIVYEIYLCKCGALWIRDFEMIQREDAYVHRTWTLREDQLIHPSILDNFHAIYGHRPFVGPQNSYVIQTDFNKTSVTGTWTK